MYHKCEKDSTHQPTKTFYGLKMSGTLALIQELGLPITIIIGFANGICGMIKWLQGILLKHIEQVLLTTKQTKRRLTRH